MTSTATLWRFDGRTGELWCFAQAVLDFDAFTGLSDMDIRVAMRNAAGPKPKKLDRMGVVELQVRTGWGNLKGRMEEEKICQDNGNSKMFVFYCLLLQYYCYYCLLLFALFLFIYLLRWDAHKLRLFVPEMAFERMVKRQIQKLEEPALQRLSRISFTCGNAENPCSLGTISFAYNGLQCPVSSTN